MAVPFFSLAPDLTVSRICLGTMTFGEQNTLLQSFQLLDKAFDAGINFFDSAEMYPVPQRTETQGRSEEYFGRWLRDRKIPRHRVVLATKVSGPSGQMTWIRNGPKSLDAKNVAEAIDNRLNEVCEEYIFCAGRIHSTMGFTTHERHTHYLGEFAFHHLLRVGTDYIDLYQIHWPDRYVPMFGETDYNPIRQFNSVSIEEQLDALGRAIDSGKIRYIGLSNETPYGVMKFLQLAQSSPSYPRIVSVQNSYNLLCRSFDSGLAECCHHESPLAMGILSGKYLSPARGPIDARLNLYKGRYSEGESRYNLSNAIINDATRAYLEISETYGVHPVSLATAFVLSHPLVACVVFGATKLWQLQEVVEACNVKLSPEIIEKIDEVHSRFPNPCP